MKCAKCGEEMALTPAPGGGFAAHCPGCRQRKAIRAAQELKKMSETLKSKHRGLSLEDCIADLKDYIDGLRASIKRNAEYEEAVDPGGEDKKRLAQYRLNTLDTINELERIISCWREGFRARNSKG